jgi:glycosyltransferase involved in cell wall biosynthesis
MKVSIIIPFYNEEENIPNLVNTLSEFCKKTTECNFEIVFVNDGSIDNSLLVIENIEHSNYTAKIISLSKNFGSHAALRAGITVASGDFISFMYADLQDPLELIIEMLNKIKESVKNEIVWATRRNVSSKFSEKLFSKFYSSLMKKFVLKDYPINGFDIVMFSSKIQHILNANIESNSSIFLQILTTGFHQETIHYDKKIRAIGKSKWTISKKIKLFIDSFVAFSYIPIRFVTILGFTLFMFGMVFTFYLLFRKLVLDNLVSGWTMLISVLCIGFGVTNISLGIIAEYLWRTFDASRKRPVFIIDQIIEIN